MAYNGVAEDLLGEVELTELISKLDKLTLQLIRADINLDGFIDHSDLSAFVPQKDAAKLIGGNSELLDDFLQAILNGSQNELTILARQYLLSSLAEINFQSLAPNFYSLDFFIEGNLLYAAGTIEDETLTAKSDHLAIRVFDISDITAISLVSGLDMPSLGVDHFNSIQLGKYNNRLFAAVNNLGLAIIDVSDPALPETLTTYEINEPITGMLIGSGVIYLGTFEPNSIIVLDISSSGEPVELDSVDGVAFAMELASPYLYVYGNGLSVYNVGDPTDIFLLDNLQFPSGSGRNIAFHEGFVYIPTSQSGTQNIDIYDVNNVFDIRFSDKVNGAGFVKSIKVEGDDLYTKTEDTVATYKIVSPGKLSLVDSRASTGLKIDVDEDNVYLAGASSLLVYAKRSLNELKESFASFRTELGAHVLEVNGDYAYIGDDTKLLIADISNPSQSLNIVGNLQLGHFIEDIKIVNGMAYLASGVAGLAIVDISDPTSPRLLATDATLNTATLGVAHSTESISIVGDFAYTVLPTLNTVAIYNISSPSSPELIQQIQNVPAYDVDLYGASLVVRSFEFITIFNVSDPNSPQQIAQFSQESSAMHISDNFLYLTTLASGLSIYDISDPSSPVFQGSAAGLGIGNAVTVQGEISYVANEFGFVDVYDTSSKTSPLFVAQIKFNGTVKDVASNSNYVFAVNVVGIAIEPVISSLGNLQ
jgi:hypothetical protein